MEEKRPERKNCKVFMKVFNDETDELIGFMVNVTTEGLMLTSEKPLEKESDFQLRVILPAEIKGEKEVTLSATSRWCEQEEDNPEFYNTGFEFKDVPSKTIKIIKGLIKNYCFKD